MNRVELMGRLARDPEIRQGETMSARFTVAVSRRKKDETDFISCVAFGKTAELLDKYFHKGHRIGVSGRLLTGSYEKKDGTRVYTTDVVADEIDFIETKAEAGSAAPAKAKSNDGFVMVPDDVTDDELPFN